MSLKCLFGHQWNGCKCERCGKIRDEGHNFVPVAGKCIEKCTICGKECTVSHQWNKCKCKVCGQTRITGSLNDHDFPYINGELSCTCTICGYNAGKWHHWEYSYVKGQAGHKRVCSICGATDTFEHYFENGKCTYCGFEPGIDINQVVCDFASYVSLTGDYKELDDMECKLLAEGGNAEDIIFGFLARCSYGGVGDIMWWKQSKRLVKLLGKFNSQKTKQYLEQLVSNKTRTNSWEYHTEIADIANEELNRLK